MGETRVAVTIRNPAARQRSWEGDFLVDTGAIDSVVPRRHLEAIGIEPFDVRTHRLADGSVFRAGVATADIGFMGKWVGGTVIYGSDDAQPLLGLTALESGGFAVDPVNGELRPTILRL